LLLFCVGWFGFGHQFFEQSPVVDHRLTQLFGPCLSALMVQRDLMRRPVVLHDMRMVDREIRGALVEIADGIAPGFHHFAQQIVGTLNGLVRVIDKI